MVAGFDCSARRLFVGSQSHFFLARLFFSVLPRFRVSRDKVWAVRVPLEYTGKDGAKLVAVLGARRIEFHLPQGVRPGDTASVQVTECGEVVRVTGHGTKAPAAQATSGAAGGQGRAQGQGKAGGQPGEERGGAEADETSDSESEGYVDPSERTTIRVRKVRSDKGVPRGPRRGAAEDAVRMGPVVRLRLEHGYGRELPPGHRAMLQGGGEKPDWAKEYGSGNSGEEGGRMPVGWRERVRRAAARAEEEERQAQRDLDEEARAEHAARTAAADLPGGGKLAVDGRTGAIEGEALCEWEGEESDAEHGADGGAVIEVRAYEMNGEARGDEARPEPRL